MTEYELKVPGHLLIACGVDAKGISTLVGQPDTRLVMQKVGSRIDGYEERTRISESQISSLIMIAQKGVVNFDNVEAKLDKALITA